MCAIGSARSQRSSERQPSVASLAVTAASIDARVCSTPRATPVDPDVNNTTASTRHLIVSIDDALCHGATLETASLYLQGKAGHAGLPAVMPGLSIVRWDATIATVQSLRAAGMVDDASGTTAAYQALHGITFTPDQYNVIDKGNYNYGAVICNEADTNALNQLRLYGLELTMSARGYR